MGEPGSPAAIDSAEGQDSHLTDMAWLCSGPRREGRFQQLLWRVQFAWWRLTKGWLA
jgi:hypothetical protein